VQRHDFGVGAANGLGAAFSEQPSVNTEDGAAHSWIGLAMYARAFGESQHFFDQGMVH
jgi:hypothetical protein